MIISKISRHSFSLKDNVWMLWAILGIVLVTTLLQGYFTWNSINNELNNRKRLETNVRNDQIEYLKNNVARVIDNLDRLFEEDIDSVHQIPVLLCDMLKQNPEILGACVAYVPDFSPEQGRCYAPYAYRENGNIRIKKLVYDYTHFEWYLNAVKQHRKGWCTPYTDQDGTFALMTTYSVPLRNDSGQTVAVLTADLPMSQLRYESDNTYHKASMRGIIILIMQLFSIVLIAIIAWRAMTSMRKVNAVSKENKLINDELNIVSAIHASLLPSQLPIHPHLKIEAMMETAPQISGDFYDVLLKGDKLYFCIGDVANRGLGAALALVVTRASYHTSINSDDTPAQTMGRINKTLIDFEETQMFATFFVGQLDLSTGRLCYCNGGHLQPYFLSEGETNMLETKPNVPLGLNEWQFEEQQLQLLPGETLFFYTDGLIEAQNEGKTVFGEKKLALHLQSASADGNQPEAIVRRIANALRHHLGVDVKPSDDLTMLCLRYQ